MNNNEQIRTNTVVRFREYLEAGDEKAIMLVVDDYGTDSNRCLVQHLCTGLRIKPTKVYQKSELVVAELTPFQKQDIFHESMTDAYLSGQIPEPTFKPYFDWKLGKTVKLEVSKAEAHTIIEKASELLESYYDKYPDADNNIGTSSDIWYLFHGYGKDKYIVSYLQKIEDEVTNLLFSNLLI